VAFLVVFGSLDEAAIARLDRLAEQVADDAETIDKHPRIGENGARSGSRESRGGTGCAGSR